MICFFLDPPTYTLLFCSTYLNVNFLSLTYTSRALAIPNAFARKKKERTAPEKHAWSLSYVCVVINDATLPRNFLMIDAL
jgi:hypothetical protein